MSRKREPRSVPHHAARGARSGGCALFAGHWAESSSPRFVQGAGQPRAYRLRFLLRESDCLWQAEMGGAELAFVSRQNECPLDCVLQFANIARPLMLPQEGSCGQRDSPAGDERLLRQGAKKMLGQGNDV